MKHNFLKISTGLLIIALGGASFAYSFADTISDAPFAAAPLDISSEPERTAIEIKNAAPETETKAPETAAEAKAAESSKEAPESAGKIVFTPRLKVEGQSVLPGNVQLGFDVVSPAFSYNGIFVAEGSVQLKNGTWAEIGHDQYIKAPYFRLLREETDRTGAGWYVVAAFGNHIGRFYTPDRSVATELWLKKDECKKTSVLDLSTIDEKRQQIVRIALMQLGKQYKYNGSGPDAFDCSGLVHYVYSEAGIEIPRNSSAICAMDSQVDINNLKPGDIVGRPGHVGIYIGNDIFVHAAETSQGVMADTLTNYNSKNHFNHYINVIDR